MSEKISRRVFLKTTGFAALSVAAASVLGGCELNPLPGNATLPAVNNDDYIAVSSTTNSYEIAASAFSADEWNSLSVYEPDGKGHYYIYLGLYIKSPSLKFTLRASNIKCSCGTVYGIGNVRLNSDASRYTIDQSIELEAGSAKGYPLYIDLGDKVRRSSLNSTEINITITVYGKTVKIHYLNVNEAPNITVE